MYSRDFIVEDRGDVAINSQYVFTRAWFFLFCRFFLLACARCCPVLVCSISLDIRTQQNGDWQKKIASLMLTQQKTREEARTEHGGRGVEKEATPVHESEKHYAESLASIVSCRERLQEQQVKQQWYREAFFFSYLSCRVRFQEQFAPFCRTYAV